MITIIALVLQVLISLVSPTNSAVVIIPPMPNASPQEWAEEIELIEWEEFWSDSFIENLNEFDALFNSYSYKLSKNGRSMINGKFVKMGA